MDTMSGHDHNVNADYDKNLNPNGGELSLFANVPNSLSFKKLRKRLIKNTRQALNDFAMLAQSPHANSSIDNLSVNELSQNKRPRWLVALSGGKDSYGLLAILLELQWRGLLPVDLLACNLDQGQPNFPKTILPDFLNKHHINYRIEYQDTYSIVTDKISQNATYCALCSRLRRGHLYRIAREEGCDAVILGHHREDFLETFFLNLFHGGRLASMSPKLINDDEDVMVMRPLVYCAEKDLAKYATDLEFPIIPCDLCGSQDGLQRNAMKKMINDIELKMPGRKDCMIKALGNIRPSHMLDGSLFDFAKIAINNPVNNHGNKGFD